MYHDVYLNIFNQLYKLIEKEQPDFVVVAGDVAHTKTNISPEFVELASKFFKNIADRVKKYLIIILGNHDLNLKAKNRQDALSPIVEALAHPKIHLQKESRELYFPIGLYDVRMNVLSELDKEKWKFPRHPNDLNIAIYHGTINGSKVDSGFSLDMGDNPNILYGNDYALLGDVHCQGQVLKQSWEEKFIDESELDKYLSQGWQIDEF